MGGEDYRARAVTSRGNNHRHYLHHTCLTGLSSWDFSHGSLLLLRTEDAVIDFVVVSFTTPSFLSSPPPSP